MSINCLKYLNIIKLFAFSEKAQIVEALPVLLTTFSNILKIYFHIGKDDTIPVEDFYSLSTCWDRLMGVRMANGGLIICMFIHHQTY